MPSEMTPTPPGKDVTCSYCSRDMSIDPYRRCCNDGICVSIAEVAEKSVQLIYRDAECAYTAVNPHLLGKYYITSKRGITGTGGRLSDYCNTPADAWLDAQSKLPKPPAALPAEEDLSRFSVCEKCGYEVGRGIHKCEASSPLAEFENPMRIKEFGTVVVPASDYDKLLNFTRGVVEQRDRLLQEKGGLG